MQDAVRNIDRLVAEIRMKKEFVDECCQSKVAPLNAPVPGWRCGWSLVLIANNKYRQEMVGINDKKPGSPAKTKPRTQQL